MEDILPSQVEAWQRLEEKARIFFESRGFKEIRTPLVEPTELFSRSIGEASDIVHKEMYTFEDRGGRSMTLRPEMTASVARAVTEHGLLKTHKSLRLYYAGPMFRSERPQAGRKRQFHQIGIEMINEAGPEADFEAVSALHGFLEYLGLKELELRVNDLGYLNAPAGGAPDFIPKLKDYFENVRDRLCDDCRFRLAKNVMRIFDCKAKSCQPVIDQVPWDTLAGGEAEGLKSFVRKLEASGMGNVKINRRLVRGLDYYTGIVFEAVNGRLGAQDAVAGGGRYDRLYGQLGGPANVPCTGFSVGMERVLMALGGEARSFGPGRVYIAPVDRCEGVTAKCLQASLALREKGIRVEYQPGLIDLKSHLKKANHAGARYMLILGGDEMAKEKWSVKDLDARTQTEIGMDLREMLTYFEGVIGL